MGDLSKGQRAWGMEQRQIAGIGIKDDWTLRLATRQAKKNRQETHRFFL